MCETLRPFCANCECGIKVFVCTGQRKKGVDMPFGSFRVDVAICKEGKLGDCKHWARLVFHGPDYHEDSATRWVISSECKKVCQSGLSAVESASEFFATLNKS